VRYAEDSELAIASLGGFYNRCSFLVIEVSLSGRVIPGSGGELYLSCFLGFLVRSNAWLSVCLLSFQILRGSVHLITEVSRFNVIRSCARVLHCMYVQSTL